MAQRITQLTANLIAGHLRLWRQHGLISSDEMESLIANIRQLQKNGTMLQEIPPRLISMEEAAELLGISLGMFKKSEKNGEFPFHRRQIGTSVRFLNLDVIRFMLNDTVSESRESNQSISS